MYGFVNGVIKTSSNIDRSTRMLDEPDGMHGLNRTNVAVTIKIDEHEGSWAQVLAGHDLNCRIIAASSRNNNGFAGERGDLST